MSVLKLNNERKRLLYSEYDPVRGIGSPIKRKELKITAQYSLWLPEEMFEKCELVQMFRNSKENLKPDKMEEFLEYLEEERFDYDFEFWAFRRAKIQIKQTKEIIAFKLNGAQRKILKKIDDMRLAGNPIRIKLLKARQYGGSTLIQIYMGWIQIRLRKNWHCAIVADVESQATGIRGMYKRLIDHYPESLTMAPYEGSVKNRILKERGNIISIGSMQKPDSLRSTDNSMIHLSEVGLWKKTDGKSPEDLMQSLIASVPDVPLSFIALESTAKGVGNYWHRKYNNTNDGYQQIFVGWHEVEMYQKPLEMSEVDFFATLSEYERYLWNTENVTLEGINWYRHKLAELEGDTWRMCSEYPSNPIEAFQSTGSRYYPPSYIYESRKNEREPVFIGDIFGDEMIGKKALENIRIEEFSQGKLKIWSMPEQKGLYRNQYIVTVDIGGLTAKADFSTINVLNRVGLLCGGGLSRAALWKGHLDHDHLAYKAAQIAKFFNDGLLVIEVNSLDKEEIEDTEGLNYLTVIDNVVKYYPNVFARNVNENIREGVPLKYGFYVTKKTKPALMAAKRALMRDGLYDEYSREANDEADVMEILPSGVISAVEGMHDDIEVPTATGIYVSADWMPPPAKIVPKTNTNRKVYVSEAVF